MMILVETGLHSIVAFELNEGEAFELARFDVVVHTDAFGRNDFEVLFHALHGCRHRDVAFAVR